MNTILAVVPDLAATSVALFEMEGWQRAEAFDRVLARLRMTDVVRTAPSEPLPVRLRALAGGLDRILAGARNSLWAVATLYIEHPSTGSAPGRRGMSPARLAQLYLANGALIAAAVARGVDVRLVNVPVLGRGARRRCVRCSLVALPQSPSLEHLGPGVLDAIWLGAACIASPKLQPRSVA